MCSIKRSIIRKTFEFGVPTFLSRMLGLVREILQARIMGVGVVSDAFIAAFKIPNSLRKIFAEGALTGALVPTVVSLLKKDGQKSINDLMTLSFLVFEGVLLLLCLLIFWKPYATIKLIAWGFSHEQISYAVPFLRVLVSFILFISSSALLSGALQAMHHFLVPAFAPVLLNVFFIAGLLVCKWFEVSLMYLCGFIVAGSAASFLLHLFVYFKYHFSFGRINKKAWYNFKNLVTKFIPSMIGMSIVEVNLFLDSTVASFLSKGSYTLLYYGGRLMGIPLGVFAVAFSSILLPHFSRVVLYAPKRLGFYLLESAKLVFWVTIPSAILMTLFSQKIFITLFLSDKFPAARIPEASYILIAFLIGLFFFSINKILLNIYYALHDTKLPMYTSAIAATFNFIGDVVLMKSFGTVGIALATSLAGLLQVVLLTYYLYKKYGFEVNLGYFVQFMWRYLLQLCLIMPIFYFLHRIINNIIQHNISGSMLNFLTNKAGFWLWTMPLIGIVFVGLYLTRKPFKLRMHFLD